MSDDFAIDLTHLDNASRKWLRAQPASFRSALDAHIASLCTVQRGSRPRYAHLSGSLHCLWRLRFGDTRIVYDTDDGARVVSVLRIRPRRDVYN